MTGIDFSGDIAFVTGATTGIGRAVGKALAAAGARTVLTGMGDEEANTVLSEIRAEGGTAEFVHGSLADLDGWKTMLAEAKAVYGPFSIFVHCASPRRLESQNVLTVTEDEWDAMVNTNLRSGFFLGREIAKDMRADKIKGRMVYMTSLHSYSPRNLPHYSASKAGQMMVVLELARALGPDGIRVNGVAPGAIPGGGFKADVRAFEKKIPMGRTGTPEDLAASTLTLLSDSHSPYVTGVILPVDGGLAQYNWIDRPDGLE
jgi:3-oxoacyl-[acyl-carrier protein] reductase